VLDPQSDSPDVSLFADSFAIHDAGAFVDFDFFNTRTGTGVSIRVQKLTVTTQKDGFVKYLGGLGGLEGAAPSAKLFVPSEMLFADVVGVSRHGEMAEFSFHAVCWKVAIEKGRAVTKTSHKHSDDNPLMPAFCVALIRSNLELQRHWIGSLYPQQNEIPA
jgi:hypothetical protein